jgi:hypothetical protein
MDIEEGGYKDWAVDVEPGDANSFPTEDAIEHVYVVVTDKDSGEVYEGKLFLKSDVTDGLGVVLKCAIYPPLGADGSTAREACAKAPPEGETLAKGRSFRDDAIEDAKQQEYWDSVREEQSRQLIRQQRVAQQEWKFRCKDEGGF